MFFFTLSPMMMLSWLGLLTSSLMAMSSLSWSGAWVSLELNLFSFLILMNSNGSGRVEPMIKYFIVQSIGSFMFAAGFIFFDMYMISWIFNVCLLGLFVKLGFFPFYSWVPDVVSQSSMLVSLMILSWQKFAPMMLLCLFLNSYMLWLSLVFMAMVGSIGGLNQQSVRSMSAYSSFVHSSWMICALESSSFVFISYFIFYSVSLWFFFYSSKMGGKSSLKSKSISYLGVLSVLMLMGVPPFLGFIMKFVIFTGFPSTLLLFPVMGSIISLKFYLSFFYSFLINSKEKIPLDNNFSLALFFCVLANIIGLLAFIMLSTF